jgi:hypothetical protein
MADHIFGEDFDPPPASATTTAPPARPMTAPTSGNEGDLFGGDFPVAPAAPAKSLYQKWLDETITGQIAKAAGQAMTLPGEVAQGKFNVPPKTPGVLTEEDVAQQDWANQEMQRRANSAAGFIGTGGIPSVTRAGASSIPMLNSGISPETAKIAQTAIEKYGYPVRPGQMSDNWLVRSLDSLLQKIPGSGYGKSAEAQQTAVNKGVAKLIGQDAEKVDPEVMSAAKRDLGKTYQEIYGPDVKAKIDDKFSHGILDTLDRAGQTLDDPNKVKVLNKAVSNILDKIKDDGTISGPVYQGLRQTGSVLKDLEKSPGLLGDYSREIKGHLDDLFRRTIPPDKADLLRKTDQQYAIMKQLRPVVDETGNIPPARLMQIARSGDAGKERMAFGQGGDLGELANIGQRFKTMPSSNTAENSMLLHLLQGGGIAASGIGAYMHDPLLAAGPIATGAVGAATTRLLGSYLKSPARAQKLIADALEQQPSQASAVAAPAIAATGRLYISPNRNQ